MSTFNESPENTVELKQYLEGVLNNLQVFKSQRVKFTQTVEATILTRSVTSTVAFTHSVAAGSTGLQQIPASAFVFTHSIAAEGQNSPKSTVDLTHTTVVNVVLNRAPENTVDFTHSVIGLVQRGNQLLQASET